jgi:hypothetical protein
MDLLTLLRRSCLVAFALFIACTRDEAVSHVYQSPPPSAAQAPPVPINNAPEPPIGSGGPSARITGVRLVSTGEPVALDQLTEAVFVTTLVSRGRQSSPAGPARLELRITGATDTTLAVTVQAPVPLVIAHDFAVAMGPGSGGLPPGRFAMQVRFIGAAGRRLAASVPLPIRVRPSEH